MARKTQKEIVLKALQNGRKVNAEFARKNSIGNIRQVVLRLREDGNPIYTNENGGEYSYRLGTPSKTMVSAAYRRMGAYAFGG